MRKLFSVAKTKLLSLRALELADESVARLDQWRRQLRLLDSGAILGISEDSFLGREFRGAAVIAASAETERFFREVLVAFSVDMNRSSVQACALVPTLRPLAGHSSFQSVTANTNLEKQWGVKMLLTSMEQDKSIAEFPRRMSSGPQPPLDGKTIRPSHVHMLWKLLGITGPAFPSQGSETALNSLAVIRNDVAHANDPISEIFHEQSPGKAASDIAKLIDDLALALLHWGSEISDYMKARSYLV